MKNDSEPKAWSRFFCTRVKEFCNECKDFTLLNDVIGLIRTRGARHSKDCLEASSSAAVSYETYDIVKLKNDAVHF